MLNKLKLYSDFVVLKHSLFAIPFAYLGAFLAGRGIPELDIMFWVGLAFIGARSAAMALNNLVDREIDARNPRTSGRELPSGRINMKEVWGIIIVSYFLLFYSAYRLNPLCLILAPIIPLTSVIYPYLKRSFPVSHFVLGLNLGYAPVGGWLAVTGAINIPFGASEIAMLLLLLAVTFWVAGFDILYACQDVIFDRQQGLYSCPARFGIAEALVFARRLHTGMIILLLLLVIVSPLKYLYLTGVLLVAIMLGYEHSLVKPHDLSRLNTAFFTLNGAVSLVLMVFTIMELL